MKLTPFVLWFPELPFIHDTFYNGTYRHKHEKYNRWRDFHVSWIWQLIRVLDYKTRLMKYLNTLPVTKAWQNNYFFLSRSIQTINQLAFKETSFLYNCNNYTRTQNKLILNKQPKRHSSTLDFRTFQKEEST